MATDEGENRDDDALQDRTRLMRRGAQLLPAMSTLKSISLVGGIVAIAEAVNHDGATSVALALVGGFFLGFYRAGEGS